MYAPAKPYIYTLGMLFLLLLKAPGHFCGNSCSCVCGAAGDFGGGAGGPGTSLSQGRIWDGSVVPEGGRPFQARLIYGATGKCGGAIYNSLTILTAAHCLYRKGPASDLRVYVGILTTPTSVSDPGFVSEAVSTVLIHPVYQQYVAGYDVGIVRLSAPIQYGPNVQPLPVMEPGVVLAGKVATGSGWGQTNRKEDVVKETSPILLQASGTILTDEACLKLLSEHRRKRNPENVSPRRYIPTRWGTKLMQSVCFYGAGGRGACAGDSGGPLTCQIDPGMEGNPTRLCGIVSSGYGCGQDAPVIHTEVNNPELFEWILENAGPPDKPTVQY